MEHLGLGKHNESRSWRLLAMTYFKAILPPEFRAGNVRLVVLKGLDKVKSGVKKDYKSTTQTWKHKPKFDDIMSLRGGEVTLAVFTIDSQYWMVDQGTKAHIIPFDVSKSKPLIFERKFIPKTVVGSLISGPGFKGGGTRTVRVVRHPGAEARNFSEVIQEKWQDEFMTIMNETMSNAASGSGHGG